MRASAESTPRAAQAARAADPHSPGWSRVAGLGGLARGGLLMLRGRRMWSALSGRSPTTGESVAVRLLAVRHLMQGTAQLTAPRRVLPAALALDLLHGASMAVLAVADRSRARPALVSAAVSLATAAMATAGGADGRSSEEDPRHPADGHSNGLDSGRPARITAPMTPSPEPPPANPQDSLYAAQQRLIDDLLMLAAASPSLDQMERLLREGLQERGLPSPPETWIEAVAEKLAAGRLYVVAPRTVDVRAVAEAAPGDPLKPEPPYGIS